MSLDWKKTLFTIACYITTGAGLGGLNGFYSGLKDVQARQLTGANRRTQ